MEDLLKFDHVVSLVPRLYLSARSQTDHLTGLSMSTQ